MTRSIALTTLLLLAACGSAPVRYDLPPEIATVQIPVSYGAIEVREVTLPRYASEENIYFEDASGGLVSNPGLLWADDPTRSFTEGLAFSLAAQTRARVAAEPWPFSDFPDARVDVRFSRALAGNDGYYRIAGQYFVAPVEGARADVARRFAIAEPYDALDLPSIAAAKGRAIGDLAALIARDGL
ncbi:hypothetical protein LX81_01507 [Palleronia aestuarii]|uniref:ABC-type transport auxiliary lipoprotein component domain-containing protein n=1 Tax=Palleronia aestuarii TaxID=568105 RepID=A0A2W7NC81_9RHOB|nr:ABC-type transport auxiliary lipoprotein family protein [Palleronia aestuarii]PZX17778.1 hypothetical protein LX81_01507 [Palleronia aestuarii]